MLAETAFITKIIKQPPMKQPTSAADIKFSSTQRNRPLVFVIIELLNLAAYIVSNFVVGLLRFLEYFAKQGDCSPCLVD